MRISKLCNSVKLCVSITAIAALVSACGGGGGGGATAPAGPVASTLSFPLQTGFKSLIANGYTKSFNVSGTCNGSGTETRAPASTGTTFEGVTALSSVVTITGSFTNCTPSSFASSGTTYVDTNYNLLGYVGADYDVWPTSPTVPMFVSVGATAIAGTENFYTSSAKTTPAGWMDASFVIEADTASTAIVNLISKSYDASGVLTSTEQARYRMTSTGALTPISDDIQYANGSTTHLILTYN